MSAGTGTGTPASAPGISAVALVTLAAARSYLGKAATDTADDAIIETVIDAVSAKFDRYCGRALAKATDASLYLDGSGEAVILLPRYPVVSIASVVEDGTALTVGDDEDDAILYANEGMIKKVGAIWRPGSQNVLLTSFVAGYVVQGVTPGTGETALPADLKLAALTQVAADFQAFKKRDWGEVSRTFPDGSVTRSETGALLKEVQRVLDGYRDIRI